MMMWNPYFYQHPVFMVPHPHHPHPHFPRTFPALPLPLPLPASAAPSKRVLPDRVPTYSGGSSDSDNEDTQAVKRAKTEELDAVLCLLSLSQAKNDIGRNGGEIGEEGEEEEEKKQENGGRQSPLLDVDLPDYDQIRTHLRVLNSTFLNRVEPRKHCPCRSLGKMAVRKVLPCRVCLCTQGMRDLQVLLTNTKRGNNVFESWGELQAFCNKEPQRDMLGIVADILEDMDATAREGVRKFANHAVKIAGFPVSIVSSGWAQDGLNLGVTSIMQAINMLVDDGTLVKYSTGSHIRPEACARTVLLYFFLRKYSADRPTRRKENLSDVRDRKLYDEYRKAIRLPRVWHPLDLLFSFKTMK